MTDWQRAPTADDIARSVIHGQRDEPEQQSAPVTGWTDEQIAAMEPEEIVARAQAGDEDLRRRLPSMHQRHPLHTTKQAAANIATIIINSQHDKQ